ncbi:MAG: hypothetical protein ABIJ45_02075 [Candidatus Zixiibacteriota bacterium]
MFREIRKPYLILMAISIVLAGMVITARYTGACRLKNVEIGPEKYASHASLFKNEMEKKLFDIDIYKISDELIKNEKVLSIHLNYDLPDGLNLQINDIEPSALIIDKNGRNLYRLSADGFIIPIDSTVGDIAYPVITGIDNCFSYKKADDTRLDILIDQLEILKDNYTDYYLALSSIDMSNKDYISIFLDGIPCPIKTYAGTLCDTIRRLQLFLSANQSKWSEIKKLDMRSDKIIVAAG